VLQWHFLVFSIFDAVRFCLNEEKILTSAWNFIIFPSVATTFVILSVNFITFTNQVHI